MPSNKPTTRTEASAPQATKHLTENQKKALDLSSELEHSNAHERTELTKEIEKLGDRLKGPSSQRASTTSL